MKQKVYGFTKIADPNEIGYLRKTNDGTLSPFRTKTFLFSDKDTRDKEAFRSLQTEYVLWGSEDSSNNSIVSSFTNFVVEIKDNRKVSVKAKERTLSYEFFEEEM